MRTSLTLSASLHLIVLAVILLNFAWGGRKAPPELRPVAVEILSPSDLSRAKAGTPDKPEDAAGQAGPQAARKDVESPPAAPDPKPAEHAVEMPAKKQAALPPPPKPRSRRRSTAPIPARSYTQAQDSPAPRGDAPLPVRRPEPDREKMREADARYHRAAPRAAEPERDTPRHVPERGQERHVDRIASLLDTPEAERKPPPRFDPNRIAALLNHDPDAGGEPREQRPREPWRHPSSFQDQAAAMTPEPGERAPYGQPSGRDDRMSASEIDAFIAQVSRCWTPPVGGMGAESIVVRLHIELREDGRLAGPPQVANSGSSPFFTPAADSAVRAVLQCAPYRMPPEKYSHWRDMLLNFDPRQMYGG